jgi:hypothetical protein
VQILDKKAALSILKNRSFLLLTAGLSVLLFGFFTPLFFIKTYSVDIGMSTRFAFYLPSIVNAASFFGTILPGILADRYGPFNILPLDNCYEYLRDCHMSLGLWFRLRIFPQSPIDLRFKALYPRNAWDRPRSDTRLICPNVSDSDCPLVKIC